MSSFREQDVRFLVPPSPRKFLVAHAWADYVPETYIEPHSHLRSRSDFESLNLVSRLWDNGKVPDPHTVYLERKSSDGLVKPGDVARIINRLTHGGRWNRFRDHCRNSIKGRGVQLLHSHFGTTGCELYPIAAAAGIPHVVTFYGYDGSAALKQPETVAKYKAMFRSAQRFIVLCDEVEDRLVRLGCPAEKISVWNMPAGIEKFPLVARRSSPVFRIVMAARFAEAKGHLYLLEALGILAREGLSIHATLIGYGNLLADIRDRISSLGIEANVTVLDTGLRGDFSTQFREVLAHCDAYALPSITDRHGTDESGPALTMVCAQASGLPGVVTPFPGASLSFQDGETGFFCREKDPASLAYGLRRLALNPYLRQRMGVTASAMAHESFTEIKQNRRLVEMYYELLGASRSIASDKAGAAPFVLGEKSL
jgi:colanic acid/amylovoran biosynthesis glycosyltransferase